MKFYDTLQLDPAVLKAEIKKAGSAGEKMRLVGAMAVRAVLLVAFAIIFITSLTALFGDGNSNFAVVIFCRFPLLHFGFAEKSGLYIFYPSGCSNLNTDGESVVRFFNQCIFIAVDLSVFL